MKKSYEECASARSQRIAKTGSPAQTGSVTITLLLFLSVNRGTYCSAGYGSHMLYMGFSDWRWWEVGLVYRSKRRLHTFRYITLNAVELIMIILGVLPGGIS